VPCESFEPEEEHELIVVVASMDLEIKSSKFLVPIPGNVPRFQEIARGIKREPIPSFLF